MSEELSLIGTFADLLIPACVHGSVTRDCGPFHLIGLRRQLRLCFRQSHTGNILLFQIISSGLLTTRWRFHSGSRAYTYSTYSDRGTWLSLEMSGRDSKCYPQCQFATPGQERSSISAKNAVQSTGMGN